MKMMKTEVYNKKYHYFTDENNVLQGEYKSWYTHGQLFEHKFYLDGRLHGEYKSWQQDGALFGHVFYENGVDITHKVSQYLDNDLLFALVTSIPRLPASSPTLFNRMLSCITKVK